VAAQREIGPLVERGTVWRLMTQCEWRGLGRMALPRSDRRRRGTGSWLRAASRQKARPVGYRMATILTAASDLGLSASCSTGWLEGGLSRLSVCTVSAITSRWGRASSTRLGILAGLWQVLPKARFAAQRLRSDMNLMTIAVAGAVAIGEWPRRPRSLFFACRRAGGVERYWLRRAVDALLILSRPRACRSSDGKEEVMPPTASQSVPWLW
jgi:hypothetical protein